MTASVFRADALAGRTALVTGASSGLGRHFAGVLAAHGAQVVISARHEDELAAVIEEIGAAGGRAHAVVLDVRDPASVEAGVRAAVAAAGRLDILVNNAGVTVTRPALAMTEDEWRRVVDTNLDGAFRVARAVARTMVEAKSGGVIVNIASVLALRVGKLVAGYVAAKAGFLRLSEALALEWAMHGIRVNAIAPGYVVTNLNRAFLTSPAGETMIKRIPLRRFGEPADLDGALLLLASDAGRYLTGSTITVDGGHTLAWL
ncbi:MAG: SDR family oxidoreductase [Burkholderiales bacterium]|nr:SDR family oxidoreductase [Burkholderiales bacterium]